MNFYLMVCSNYSMGKTQSQELSALFKNSQQSKRKYGCMRRAKALCVALTVYYRLTESEWGSLCSLHMYKCRTNI